MFPQNYDSAGRSVYFSNNRLMETVNQWKATMAGNIMYCSDYGASVRMAVYENQQKFLYRENNPEGFVTSIQGIPITGLPGMTVQENIETIRTTIYNRYKEQIAGQTYYTNVESGATDTYEEADVWGLMQVRVNGTDLDKWLEENKELAYALSRLDYGALGDTETREDWIQNDMVNIMKTMYNQLNEGQNAKRFLNNDTTDASTDDANAEGKNMEPNSAVYGPKVVVMQQPDGTHGYKEKEKYSFNNEKLAFIFSACENAYGTQGAYAQKYSVFDIQTAYWQYLARDNARSIYDNASSRIEPTKHITSTDLYEKSVEYENFVKNIMNNNLSAENYQSKTKINTNEAQVIVDRKNGKYIIGPYSVTYPYVEDVSYMRGLTLTANGKTLIYDDQHSDFQLVMQGVGVKNANGLTKEYPNAGQKFFVVFEANKLNKPTKVALNVQFEYLSETRVDSAQLFTADAQIYQYMGYCLVEGEESQELISGNNYQALKLDVQWRLDYQVGKYTEAYFDHDDNTECMNGKGVDLDGVPYHDHNRCTGHWVNPQRYNEWMNNPLPNKNIQDPVARDEARWNHVAIYVPFIKMEKIEGENDAQETLLIQDTTTITIEGDGQGQGGSGGSTSSGNGNAQRTYARTEQNAKIDLSIELGGYVWADEEGGKESVANGTYDSSEKRVPHIKVTLSDGQTTVTNSNGEYKFTGLNAMNTYTITFEYNGQYYQPTQWQSGSTWGSGSWATNSNAKDDQSERESFNLKFEYIGSSPENYTTSTGANRTYTKQELQNAGVIDEFGNLVGGGNSSMVQYVNDCMMKAYTFDVYPYPSLFVIDTKPVTREYTACFHNKPAQLYNDAYYINLGLDAREESDLAIKKDVDHVTLEINGQTHTYTYDTLENKENAEKQWDINVRLSDGYYNTAYSRELYKSDYLYKASMYGDTDTNNDGIGDVYGKSKADELEVYITYKIMVRNQAMSIRAKVNELVDYYDQDLEYVEDRSYIQVKQSRNNALQKGIYSVGASNTSIYSPNTTTKIDGYDALYITGLAKTSNDAKENYLAAGQTAYIYLTFKVKKEARDGEDWVKLDEKVENGEPIGVGKENIIEVNGYATQYAEGTQVPNIGDVSFKPAGIVDTDSNPGNLADTGIQKDKADTSVFAKFEDDTDKAPNIRIVLHRDDEATRVISGSVWEDARTQDIEVTTTGDGFKDEEATMINGVTVQLVELMENGTEYVWREFGDNAVKQGELGGQTTIGKGSGSGTVASETPIINAYNLVEDYKFAEQHNGQYAFKSFMPGKYIIRFIYGDTVKTVTPASLNMGGLNEKSYNGQDYKSTTYQKGVDQNKVYTWREPSTWSLGQETLGKVITEVSTFKPDASNNETTNAKLSATEQKGYLYDITASDKQNNVSDAKDIESRRNIVNDYSDNDVINHTAEVLASHKADYDTRDDRAQLLNELMQNTKMTAETGLMVIELEYDKTGTPNQTQNNKASYKIQNVDLGLEERPKAQLVIDKEVTNVKLTLADGSILFDAKNTASNVLWKEHKAYQVGYKGNVMDPAKFGNLQNIRNKNASKFGLVQLTMDEELMHGATIEIAYQVTLTNIGEVDYKDNLFYYTGNKSDSAQVVTTRANQVIDYVANNLQFNASNNSNWKVIEKNVLNAEEAKDSLVNNNLKAQVEKYNTVIVTEALSKDLVPSLYKEKVKSGEDSVSVPLVLTQLITTENDTDDLTYRNLVEIVKTSNTIGRRMEYSVVGNQDPEANPQELDSDIAEVVRILPPFGRAINYIILAIIAIVVISIATGGIIFIKKKVLKK